MRGAGANSTQSRKRPSAVITAAGPRVVRFRFDGPKQADVPAFTLKIFSANEN